jgi:hypothetical protein
LNPKYLRFGLALVLVGFLLVFFVPVVYDAALIQCSDAFACPSNQAGLQSIGVVLFGWGAVYGFAWGYSASMAYWGSFTTLGVLLFLALPAGLAAVCCAAPEIVRKSLASRIGFTLFGGFAFALSALMFASMLGGGFNLALAVLAVVLFSSGSNMVIYGVRPKLFQIPTEQPSQS